MNKELSHEISLPQVERTVRRMLARLKRPDEFYHLRRHPGNDGSAHVEGEGPTYDLVVTEAGVELSRETLTGDELLFAIMQARTCALAQQAEMVGRGTESYSRWRWMDAHIRLMGALRPEWGHQLRDEYRRVLEKAPLRTEEVLASLELLDLEHLGVH